ncbi:MAG: TonB-dependent receptor plug domain-containing protein [Hyphomonas sp.]|uniref:TonB-dependent receptor plug domain-containing protein n=1 Tax=Hyphomonas sp. TaxID=87 RepID=UPI003528CDAF
MSVGCRLFPSIVAGVAILVSANNAWADPDAGSPGGESGTSFTIDDFAQYNPRTALDMVRRVPGFSIQSDDDGSRGFGQATGNVLIDGQRVSGKSNGAAAALRRISADRVTRIDLVDGARLDIPGLSGQVVNVITSGEGGLSGTWRWKSRVRENLTPYFHEGEVALSGGSDALSWSLEASSLPERGANAGWETTTDGASVLLERRKEDFTFIADNASVSGSLAWKPDSGAVGNLNGKVGIWQSDLKEVSKTFPVGETEGRRLFLSGEDEWNAEFGGDYEFGLGPGRLKGIGLIRLEHSPIVNSFTSGALDGTDLSSSRFLQTTDEGEYIARAEYSLASSKTRDWQVSFENAFNFLEAESALSESVGGGPFVDIPLDGANTRVEEKRMEANLTHSRQLMPKLRLQVSLGAEYSELSQSGDNANLREFTRPKGFASLSWQAQPSLKVTTRLERDVGQLNFSDFISSVNLNAENGREGNSEIVPQQDWTLSVQAEKDMKDWGAATFKVFYSDIEDIVDRVPIGTGDGPGNLDSAWQIGAEMDVTLKLDKLGVAGGELKSNAEWYDSEVEDPLTGVMRPINGNLAYYFNFEFRQDIPNSDWAWGALVDRYKVHYYYQLGERGIEFGEPGYSNAFIERKNFYGMTATFAVGNLLNQQDGFERQIYSPNRLGSVVRKESRGRRFGPIAIFELKGTF